VCVFTSQPTVTDECYFLEKLEENHYNTYASQKYQTRNWYVALKKNGRPKLGSRTHIGQKAIFFLPRRLGDSREWRRAAHRTAKPQSEWILFHHFKIRIANSSSSRSIFKHILRPSLVNQHWAIMYIVFCICWWHVLLSICYFFIVSYVWFSPFSFILVYYSSALL